MRRRATLAMIGLLLGLGCSPVPTTSGHDAAIADLAAPADGGPDAGADAGGAPGQPCTQAPDCASAGSPFAGLYPTSCIMAGAFTWASWIWQVAQETTSRILFDRTDILFGRTHVLLGRTHILLGRTHILLGRTHVLFGRTHIRCGAKDVRFAANHQTFRLDLCSRSPVEHGPLHIDLAPLQTHAIAPACLLSAPPSAGSFHEAPL